MEDLSINLQESIKELKEIFENIEKNKEQLKINIQTIFTKLRNIINEREDELLLNLDNKFNELYFNENIIKESEKLPNRIKLSIEKGKKIDKEWNDDNLNSLINDCINIENNIIEINKINEDLKKSKSNKNIEINFIPQENNINQFLETIQTFGKINVINNNINLKNIQII